MGSRLERASSDYVTVSEVSLKEKFEVSGFRPKPRTVNAEPYVLKGENKMKTKRLLTLGLAGLLVTSLATTIWAQSPKMKMTTDIPPGIASPDKLKTRIGALTSVDGVPDEKTTQLVYDNLDFQRAVQAYLSSIQIASMDAMRKGALKFGPANTTALLFENLMDSKALFLTPNTTSVYQMSWLEMTNEPWVIETPPKVLGIIDDHWFKYVTDFGNAGPDKGKGGKFLILPPGYKGEVPEGYHVARTNTYGNWVIWRGFQVDGNPAPAIEATKKLFRLYGPLQPWFDKTWRPGDPELVK